MSGAVDCKGWRSWWGGSGTSTILFLSALSQTATLEIYRGTHPSFQLLLDFKPLLNLVTHLSTQTWRWVKVARLSTITRLASLRRLSTFTGLPSVTKLSPNLERGGGNQACNNYKTLHRSNTFEDLLDFQPFGNCVQNVNRIIENLRFE